MITVGVDLAAEPKSTAVAHVEWSSKGARVRDLVLGADDALVVTAISGAGKAGVDCPLGWPVPFVEFVSRHDEGHVAIPEGLAALDWRRRLAYRATDLNVHELTGQPPLSVAADRIGRTAMRCRSVGPPCAER